MSWPSLQQPLFGVSQKEPSPRGAQSALVVHFGTSQDGALPQRMSPSALRMQRQSPLSLHVCLRLHEEASVQAWVEVSSGTQWHPLHCSPDGHPEMSHSSPHSTIPSPQMSSGRVQSPLQPSQSVVLPSSHTSPPSITPLPHVCEKSGIVGVVKP